MSWPSRAPSSAPLKKPSVAPDAAPNPAPKTAPMIPSTQAMRDRLRFESPGAV